MASAARRLIGNGSAGNRTASGQDILTSAATQLVAQGTADHGPNNRRPSAFNLSLTNGSRCTSPKGKKTCHDDWHSKFSHKDNSLSCSLPKIWGEPETHAKPQAETRLSQRQKRRIAVTEHET